MEGKRSDVPLPLILTGSCPSRGSASPPGSTKAQRRYPSGRVTSCPKRRVPRSVSVTSRRTGRQMPLSVTERAGGADGAVGRSAGGGARGSGSVRAKPCAASRRRPGAPTISTSSGSNLTPRNSTGPPKARRKATTSRWTRSRVSASVDAGLWTRFSLTPLSRRREKGRDGASGQL